MQSSLQRVELDELKQGLEEERKKLQARLEEVDRALEAARASGIIEHARRSQAHPIWLKELREQYNEEVCQNTLETNRLFPVAEK